MKVLPAADGILELMRERRSARVPFDPHRKVGKAELSRIIEAARWAPTPHNMQNFEIVVIDDAKTLERLGRIRAQTSLEFLRENYQQLSFSEEELHRKRVGVLAAQFPPAWRDPSKFEEVAREGPGAPVGQMINGCPTLMVVTYDPRKRAPSSEGDSLASWASAASWRTCG